MLDLLSRRRSRVVYRSAFRVLVWVPSGLALGVISFGAGLEEDPAMFVFVPIAAFILAFAVWPRLVLDREGLRVRNLTTVVIPWPEVAQPVIEAQLPLVGSFWHTVNRGAVASGGSRIGKPGYPGLVIRTRMLGSVAVMAVQRHPLREGGFPDRVLVAVEAARQADRKRQDPAAAARRTRTGTSEP